MHPTDDNNSHTASSSSSSDADMLVRVWDDSTLQFTWTPSTHLRAHPRTVPQVDLTPTLSLLLGVPVPYSNLGMVIPELFQTLSGEVEGEEENEWLLREVLAMNYIQVLSYISDCNKIYIHLVYYCIFIVVCIFVRYQGIGLIITI